MMDQSLNHLGKIVTSDSIIFENVPLLAPNGDTLVKNMNF